MARIRAGEDKTPARKRKTPSKEAKAPRTRAPKATRARPQETTAEADPARVTANAIAHLGLEKKALDVTVLDVRGLASYAEYFVVMTAESEPQMNAIADHVEAKLKEQGQRPLSIEGAQAGRWVLIDYGDVVAHVFYQDMRSFYDIEGLWADAPRFEVKD